jgi:hypothetical protein
MLFPIDPTNVISSDDQADAPDSARPKPKLRVPSYGPKCLSAAKLRAESAHVSPDLHTEEELVYISTRMARKFLAHDEKKYTTLSRTGRNW